MYRLRRDTAVQVRELRLVRTVRRYTSSTAPCMDGGAIQCFDCGDDVDPINVPPRPLEALLDDRAYRARG